MDKLVQSTSSFSVCLCQVGLVISLYWIPVFFPIGFITNILSLLVMRMKHNRHLSTATYMSIIAFSDNLKLCWALHNWFGRRYKPAFYSTTWMCKLLVYNSKFFSIFSAYEIVLMTLDKVIAIKMPHKSKSLSTPLRARKMSMLNIFITAVVCLPIFHHTSIVPMTKQCKRYVQNAWYVTVYVYTSILIYPLIPMILLSAINAVIIKTVWERKTLNFGGTKNNTKSSEMQMTVMLILVSLLFVILTMPMELRANYYHFVEVNTPEQEATSFFLFHLTRELYNTNFGINFFLYLISGRKFRSDLLTLCCCKRYLQQTSSHTGKNPDSCSGAGYTNRAMTDRI